MGNQTLVQQTTSEIVKEAKKLEHVMNDIEEQKIINNIQNIISTYGQKKFDEGLIEGVEL